MPHSPHSPQRPSTHQAPHQPRSAPSRGIRSTGQHRRPRRALRIHTPGSLVGAFCALGLLLGAVALFVPTPVLGATAPSVDTYAPSPRPPHSAAPVTMYPPGAPAIPVRTSMVSGTGAAPAVPAFTATEAAHYAQTHPLFHVVGVGAMTVVKVQFMTSEQLSARLQGAALVLPAGSLVCYVELHGTFLFTGPAGAVTYHAAYEVYNAANGNFLMDGALP